MRPLLRAAAAIPPLALRGDYWAPVTLLPYLVDALRHAGPGVQVINSLQDVALTRAIGGDVFRSTRFLRFIL